MKTADAPSKHRPSMRLVLGLMLLIAMATPLIGLFFLRVLENQLIRRTEGELISQSTVLAAVYAAEIRASGIEDVWFGPVAKGDFSARRSERFLPTPPTLDLAVDPILPPRPEAEQAMSPVPTGYRDLGSVLTDVVRATRRRTLAGLTLLDPSGRPITGREAGRSLAHVPEVAMAMEGRLATVLRTRLRERPPPLIYSVTKGASLRVFTAFPVIVQGRVAGIVYASRTPRHILQMMDAEKGKLIFAGAAMLAALAIFGFIARRAITAPIRALTERTRAVAAGDREAMRPLSHHGTAEVAELSEAFLRTSRALHDRSDDVANFAAHVSHELKSPLTAIQGAAELIRDNEDVMSPDERGAFLGNIIADTERMALLVRRLLELARADAREDEEVGAVVADTPLKGRGVEVAVSDPERPPLAISAEKLSIILTNMVDNAAAVGASTVRIICARRGRSAEIIVEDDGPGVSPANRERLFEPFFTTRRETGGTGMGLPIIRALLAARDGEIALEPGAEGARFRISLPIAD
ncbi:MAG: HAMP domain-containing sensor histidine kinase [Pseudomonadota bacterium]